MVRLPLRRDRRVRHQREVDARERDEVSLELREVQVELAVEPERRGDGRHDVRRQLVEVGVHRPLDVELLLADVVDRLVVHDERAVRVAQSGVGAEYRVVRLYHCCRDLQNYTKH